MGVFSDMNMGFTDGTGSPFEDEGVFGQASEFEQTESLPVSGGGQMAGGIPFGKRQDGRRCLRRNNTGNCGFIGTYVLFRGAFPGE